MVGNIQIPQDLTKVVEVEVKDVSKPLREFLINLTNKIETLEARIAELENE